MRKKMYIIDAMALAFRSYHAFGARPLTTSNGVQTSAIYGSLMVLLKIMEEKKPDYLVIACDSREPTFRHKMYEAYKANRTEFPEDLAIQLPYLFKLFEKLSIPLLKMPGYEADDIIASLVTKHASSELQCYIVSGDKDFMQLVSSDVCLFNPKKGGTFTIIDELGVKEKFNCKPSQVLDVLSIIGDVSDNVPGVHGIGAKGAAKLIGMFDSLENLYDCLDQVSNPRHKTALESEKDKAFLSKKLISLKKDIAINLSLDQLSFNEASLKDDNLIKFMEELEFNSIVRRLRDKQGFSLEQKSVAITKNQDDTKTLDDLITHYVEDSLDRNYFLVNNQEALSSLTRDMLAVSSFAFDTETTGLDIISDKPIGVSFSFKEGTGYYLPLIDKHLDNLEVEKIISFLKIIFSDKNKLKFAHNLKFDLQMLNNIGVDVCAPYGDSMLAAFLLDPAGGHGLDALSKNILGVSKLPTTALMGKKMEKSMVDVEIEKLSYYACEDSDCCYRLYMDLVPKLNKNNLESLYDNVEIPIVPILAKMEKNGAFINVKSLNNLSASLKERSDLLEKEVHQLASEEFNLNSPKQLQVILYDKLKIHEELGIKKLKKTKKGFSTDVSVLESMSAHPMVKKLLEYRTVTKIRNTYSDSLPKMVHSSTGRIHTNFHQNGTATGRLSSSKPNLQNIPIRTEIGQKIRQAFEPQGDKVLISADFSQIELRILAHISGDTHLREAFENGEDVHSATAAKVFGIETHEVDRNQRSQAKAINYGIAYGMGPKRFSATTGVSIKEAKDFIERYFMLFPKVRDYMNDSISLAEKNGYSETLLGRRRPLEALKNGSGLAFVNAKNMAVNSPVQGTAADLMKLAMIRVNQAIEDKGLSVNILLQIHDELLLESPLIEEKRVIELVRYEMEHAMELSVPLKVDINSGVNWLEAH